MRKASKKEIETSGLKELGLTEEEVGERGSMTKLEKLFLPPVTKEAEILEGTPDEAAAKLAKILKEKGA